MDYQESLSYIEQLNTKGIALGLARIAALLDLLGNPQEDVRCIHVAGTNGKGSVCAFMDSAMQLAGLRVGRYISPTLDAYLERFQINGTYIDKQEFAEILTEVRAACEMLSQYSTDHPTVFEVETAVAFLFFKRQQCDYVLLEVGMGGRLDSTNVINNPVLSVITSISMDHTGMLGDTLAAIAYEKAGIIKHGCSVVLAPQEPEAMEVLQEQCKVCDVVPEVVYLADLQQKQWSLNGQIFSYRNWEDVFIPLTGVYQQINAAVALEALQILQKTEPALTERIMLRGLAQASWHGRFEIISDEPLFIVDGAHNPAGALALAETIAQMQSAIDGKLWLLMGVFRDKDYRTIGQIMSRYGDTIICFQPQGERGLESTALAKAMAPYYTNVIVESAAEDAVQFVMGHASAQDIIVSFGSLSTIKSVKDAVTAWEVHHNE